jgi:acetoin utilization deacetylase AcuC-like enzyme
LFSIEEIISKKLTFLHISFSMLFMKVGYIYHPAFLEHRTLAYHPESKERLVAINRALEKHPDIDEQLIKISPRKATKAEITAVHAPDYYAMIMKSPAGHLDSDTYLSEGTKDASLYAAGAILTAIESARSGEIDRAFCAVRPPGHHAEYDEAMGFCIFNNVAVGAAFAKKNGYKKVFIVDFDVHHGNGTQHMFYDDPDVFYFSSHQSPHYPGTGRSQEKGHGKGDGTTYNIPLPAYSGDEDFIKIYKQTLPELVSQFNPDILLVSAGYDIRDKDPLSSLEVTNSGIREIVKGIMSSKKGIPVIFTLEGGYNLDALAESVMTTLEVFENYCP